MNTHDRPTLMQACAQAALAFTIMAALMGMILFAGGCFDNAIVQWLIAHH